MSRWLDIRGLLLATRIPNLMTIAMGQLLATSMINRHQLEHFMNLDLVLLIISTMMVAAGGYIINDYYDIKIDAINRPREVVVGRVLSRRKALIAHLILSVFAVGIGFFISIKIGLLHLFSVTILWYYSNHLRRFFIGKIVIAILAALSMLSIGIAFEIVSYRLMAFATFGAVIIWIRELIKDMESVLGETMFGVASVRAVWGLNGTKWLIAFIGIIGMSLLIYFLIRVDSTRFYLFYSCLAPLIAYFAYLLILADQQEHFQKLRQLTNFFVIAGLLSMLVI